MRQIIYFCCGIVFFSQFSWAKNTIEPKAQQVFNADQAVTAFVVSADGQEILIANKSNDNQAVMWKGNEKLFSLNHFSPPAPPVPVEKPKENEGIFQRILGSSTEEEPTPPPAPKIVPQQWINALALSPTGEILTSATDDTDAKLWSSKGELLRTFAHPAALTSVAFSPEPTFFLTGLEDGGAFLWKTTGEQIHHFSVAGAVNAVAFSPDGRFVLLGTDAGATLFTVDGKKRQTFASKMPIKAVAFSHDGQYVLTAAENSATLWGLDGTELQEFPQKNQIIAVAFSPDGEKVLTSSEKNAKLWTFSGDLVADLPLQNAISALAFSPDNKSFFLASGTQVFAFQPFSFSNEPTLISEKYLTSTEVGTMSRLGVKIQYDNEQSLHPLQATDAPVDVVKAIKLDLSDLLLDELPPWLEKFTQLRYLNLSHNKLTLPQLSILRQLTQLETLYLSHNPIFNAKLGGGNVFAPLDNLSKLDISNTGLSNSEWETLGITKNIIYLILSDNQLDSLAVNNFPTLKFLDSSFNQIERLKFDRVPSLEEINVNDNQLQGTLNLNLFPKSVVSLSLKNNKIEQMTFDKNQDLPNLEKLSVDGNPLAKLPASMGSTFSLQNLRMLQHNSDTTLPEGLVRKLRSYQNNDLFYPVSAPMKTPAADE